MNTLTVIRKSFLLGVGAIGLATCQNPAGSAPTPQQTVETRWGSLKPAYSGSYYSTAPVTTGPNYAAGTLSAGFLLDGQNAINFVRFLAGVPDDIALDSTMGDQAQHGAVLMAATDQLSNTPSQPGDMSLPFYQEASTATSQSLIAMGYSTFPDTIRAFMGEATGTILARRRWILNPQMQKTGLGMATNGAGHVYSDMMALDTSRSTTFSYDFTAWPSGGAFPVQFYDASSPWSVTLNPSRYQTPVAASITVTMRRSSDGRVWVLNSSSTNLAGPYFAVDTSPAGAGNCIIFLPDSSATVSAGDEYTVLVAGIKKTDGSDTSVLFTVDFFSLQ